MIENLDNNCDISTLLSTPNIITVALSFISGLILKHHCSDAYNKLCKKIRVFRKNNDLKEVYKRITNTDFNFSNFNTNIHLYETHITGYEQHNCLGVIRQSSEEIFFEDKKHQKLFEERLKYYKSGIADGVFFSEQKMALQNFSVLRGQSILNQGVKFNFEPRSYCQQQAATDVYLALSDVERKALFNNFDGNVIKKFSNTFGVSVVIITADKKLVVCTRSNNVRRNKGKKLFGIAEGTNHNDIVKRTVYPHITALRGLEDEMNIRLEGSDKNALKLVSLILNKEFYEWNMIGICDLSKIANPITSLDIKHRYKTGKIEDSFETIELEFIDFTPKDVAKYLNTNRDSIVNYSIVGAILALYERYGSMTDKYIS